MMMIQDLYKSGAVDADVISFAGMVFGGILIKLVMV